MKLVPNARNAWRWFSVQAMTASGAILAAWLAVPPDLQAKVPESIVMGGVVAVLVLGIIGRLVDQGGAE